MNSFISNGVWSSADNYFILPCLLLLIFSNVKLHRYFLLVKNKNIMDLVNSSLITSPMPVPSQKVVTILSLKISF